MTFISKYKHDCCCTVILNKSILIMFSDETFPPKYIPCQNTIFGNYFYAKIYNRQKGRKNMI